MLVPPGIYDIEVVSAAEKISKTSGNEMIVLDCQILLPGGKRGPEVSEFLTFTQRSLWKVDQVRAACGMAVVPGEEIDVEPKHFEGATATVEIGEKPGDKGDVKFNTIERWLLPDEVKDARKVAADDTDDIPF